MFMFCSHSAVYGFWPVEDSCSTGLLGVMQWQKVSVCLERMCGKSSVLKEAEGTNMTLLLQ